MKNFITGAICALAILILGWTFGQVINGAAWLFRPATTKSVNDTIQFTCDEPASHLDCINAILTSNIKTTDEAVELHNNVCWELAYINEFKRLPEATVQNVTNILLRTAKYTTIQAVIEEYLQNKNIYDNIEPGAIKDIPIDSSVSSNSSNNSSNTSPSLPDSIPRKDSVSTNATINAKSAKQ